MNLDEHGADVALYSRQFAEEQGSGTQTVCLPFYDALQEAEGYGNFKKRLPGNPFPLTKLRRCPLRCSQNHPMKL